MAKKYPNLSKILKKLLFERDMKAIDLAREVNLPQPTIHRLVTGKSSRPYEASLKPIADYFAITVDQLLGEAPLPSNQKITLPANKRIKTIPIIAWESSTDLKEAINNPINKGEVIVSSTLSDASFALIMPDFSMEPLFPKGSVLIFDSQTKPLDRSYVLVRLHDADTPVFRQLLIDLNHKYLKPLNPDLNKFPMRLLQEDDILLACLIESRHHYQPSEDNISSKG